MTEYGFFDYDLSSLDLDSVLYVEEILVAKSEMLLAQHACEIPEHQDGPTVESLLTLLVKDDTGKVHTFLFHPKSPVAQDILHCHFCHRLRLVAETC